LGVTQFRNRETRVNGGAATGVAAHNASFTRARARRLAHLRGIPTVVRRTDSLRPSLWTRGWTAETPPVAMSYAGCRQAGAPSHATHRPRGPPCHASSLAHRHLAGPSAKALAAFSQARQPPSSRLTRRLFAPPYPAQAEQSRHRRYPLALSPSQPSCTRASTVGRSYSFPLGLLYTVTPSTACQTKLSSATGGRSGRPGRATPPAADDVVPGPAAALQPSGKVRGSPGHLLRPSPAVAGHQFPSPVRYRPPEGRIATFDFFLRLFPKTRDLSVILKIKFKGSSVKEILGFSQQLQKSIKNRRNIKKCKLNFVGFLVKKSTFYRKHV
jgi:hypothetical protein